MKNLYITILIIVSAITASYAQNGTIRGNVNDASIGETLIGVSVLIEGTTTGTITDLDGDYSISVEPGNYNLVFSYISYSKQVITEVEVKSDEVTNINVQLKEDVEEIGEVVIKAERIKNSEIAIMTIQKKSANVIDGISAETFKKTGDNDAASAITRVTGVSVAGGKYVYVRGLGDRYTKTQLNGVDIPGLDPDRNTVQMDIFPANLLDNIVVYKNFSPNLPGDFTGGMVNIETKSFPSTETFSFSTSMGYTPGMNLNKEALRYKGNAGDAFAFGGPGRKLPISENSVLPQEFENNPELTSATQKFSKQLSPTRFTSPLNGSFSISKGNQIKKEKVTIGYNTALNYRYQFRHYDDYQFGRAIKFGESSEMSLLNLQQGSGSRSEQEVSWSGMLGGAIKTKKSKYILNFLHSQNAVSRSAQYGVIFPDGQNTSIPFRQFVLDYSQRSVSNLLFSGKHNVQDDKWVVEYKVSPTLSKITEPDIKSTTYLVENGSFITDNGDNAIPERFYRDLTEINAVAKMDVDHNFKIWNGKKSKLSFGFAETFKTRDYQVLRYSFLNNQNLAWVGNGDELLEEQNIWTPTNDAGTYVRAEESTNRNPNIYQATQIISGAYIMNELPITPFFKAIYGVRYERTDNWLSGFGRLPGEGIDRDQSNIKVLTSNDFLPAMNLIYNVNEDMNVRLGYSRTLARPSFKEKSFVSILDPLSNVRFIGNVDLKITNIENIDARWEWFFNRGEMVSVSGFYKHFKNPIELTGFELEPNDITPRNAGIAHVAGAEFEFRKDFGFINDTWKNLSWSANVTYVKSLIDMTKITVRAGDDGEFGTSDDISEFDARTNQLRDGETIGKFRSMFGQSPFIINTALNYSSDSLGLEANLSYNVQGKRLAVVGIGVLPDVFEQSFHSLNMKVSKTFGKQDRWKSSLQVRNILGDKREKFFESYGADAEVFESFRPRTSFSLGFSYLIR